MYRSVPGKCPKHTSQFWPARALTRDQNPIRLYRSCYKGPLKCGTWALTPEWALARDTMVVGSHCRFTGRAMSGSSRSDVGMSSPPISMSDIEAAMKRIRDLVHYTPVMTCSQLNSMSGLQLYFKCENFQKTGAFKVCTFILYMFLYHSLTIFVAYAMFAVNLSPLVVKARYLKPHLHVALNSHVILTRLHVNALIHL